MTNEKYGFVDDGMVVFKPKQCDSNGKKALDEVNKILEGAEETMDTFKEVQDKIQEIDNGLGYTKEEADTKFADKSEVYTKSDVDEVFATKEEMQSAMDSIEIPSLEGYLTTEEAEELYQPKEDYVLKIAEPGERQIVYTTTDNKKIEKWYINYNGDNIQQESGEPDYESHEYYPEKGYGVITFKDNKICDDLFSFQSTIDTVKIGSSIETIGRSAFIWSSLRNVSIPYGVKDLQYWCFGGTKNLEYVYLPDSVEKMHISFFHSGLRAVRLSKGITAFGYASFADTQLTSLIIPDGIAATSIGMSLCYDCRFLHNVYIPEGITEIIQGAFCNTNIKYPILPNSLTILGNCAFGVESAKSNNKSVDFITIPKNVTDINLGLNCYGRVGTIVIPETVTNFGMWWATYPEKIISSSPIFNPTALDKYYPLEEIVLKYSKGVVTGLNTALTNALTNALKIYVPANLLAQYKETYPTLAKYLYPLTGEDTYHDLSNYLTKEEAADEVEGVSALVTALQEKVAKLEETITKLSMPSTEYSAAVSKELSAGGDITIVKDVKIETGKDINLIKNSNVDLGGHTLSSIGGNYGDTCVVGNGAEVTISNGEIVASDKATAVNASATILVKTASASKLTLNNVKSTGIHPLYVNSANEGTLVTINGGEFYTTMDLTDVDSDHMAPAVYVACPNTSTIGGKVIINGGTFGSPNVVNNFLLNVQDKLRQVEGKRPIDFIEVRGGKYYNFDPSNNKAEGQGTNFVAEGYKVTSTQSGADTIYEVAPKA